MAWSRSGLLVACLGSAALGVAVRAPPGPSPGDHAKCRVAAGTATETVYAWRNAYTPSHVVADSPDEYEFSPVSGYSAHTSAFCAMGVGPWANWSDTASVQDCAALCSRVKCTCFDYLCPDPQSAECACPTMPPPPPPAPGAKRVSCVGDSITAGYLSSCGLNYPGQLQGLLGPKYTVSNFGVGGTTLLRHADHPWWDTSAYKAALNSTPDIVVIMLGTNDAKVNNWGNATLAAQFPTDYAALIDEFKQLPTKPEVLIMVPPPLYRDTVYNMNQTVINTLFPDLVPAVANANGLARPIDLFGLFEGHCPVAAGTPGHPPNSTDLYCDWIGWGGIDGCHPNDVGYLQVAKQVHLAIESTSAA